MKKIIAIPLLVLYLVAVSGMMVQLHFCGSKLSSWEVNEPETASCCCGESTAANAAVPKEEKGTAFKANDCCKDKTITLKITQDQYRADNILGQIAALQAATLPSLPVSLPFTVSLPRTATEAYRANAPPGLWQCIPLYKLHSRFTYYG